VTNINTAGRGRRRRKGKWDSRAVSSDEEWEGAERKARACVVSLMGFVIPPHMSTTPLGRLNSTLLCAQNKGINTPPEGK